MVPPPKKKPRKSRKTEDSDDDAEIKPESAEYSDHKNYRKTFKADKRYAKRHRVYMFVQRGPFDWTKLHFAVWREQLKAVKKYVEYHQTEKPEVLLQQGQWHETALQLALRMERSPRMIKELLRGKGKEAVNMHLEEYYFKDIDDEDLWYGTCFYPIHEAVNYKNHKDAYEVTKLLIENGADIHKKEYRFEMQPLEMAAGNGHLKVVQLLLEKGATVKESKLIKASMLKFDKESAQLLEFLLVRNPNYIKEHKDVLLSPSKQGNIEALKVLLKAGAKVGAKDEKGRTAMDVVGKDAEWSMSQKKTWPQKMEQIKKLLEKHVE